MTEKAIQLHFDPACVSWFGPLSGNREHAHHAIQLQFCDTSEQLQLIPSDLPHSIPDSGEPLLLMLVEPESPTGRMLHRNKHTKAIYAALQHSLKADNTAAAAAQALKSIAGEDECGHDTRVERVFQKAPDYCRRQMHADEIAAEAFLSTSRFQHLFREQTGMPLAKYLAWRRIRIAAESIFINQSDLSMAAYEAGFSDYAHLSRFFKNMFGFNISELMKNSENLQVSFSENV